jgi:hypothetical protein
VSTNCNHSARTILPSTRVKKKNAGKQGLKQGNLGPFSSTVFLLASNNFLLFRGKHNVFINILNGCRRPVRVDLMLRVSLRSTAFLRSFPSTRALSSVAETSELERDESNDATKIQYPRLELTLRDETIAGSFKSRKLRESKLIFFSFLLVSKVHL